MLKRVVMGQSMFDVRLLEAKNEVLKFYYQKVHSMFEKMMFDSVP